MLFFVEVQTRGGEMPWLVREASLHRNGDDGGTYISRRVTPAIAVAATSRHLFAGGHHVRGDKERLVYASYPQFWRCPLDDRVRCCVTAGCPASPRTRANASIAWVAVFGLASKCEAAAGHFCMTRSAASRLAFSACGRTLFCGCLSALFGSPTSFSRHAANGFFASPLRAGRDATLAALTE